MILQLPHSDMLLLFRRKRGWGYLLIDRSESRSGVPFHTPGSGKCGWTPIPIYEKSEIDIISRFHFHEIGILFGSIFLL